MKAHALKVQWLVGVWLCVMFGAGLAVGLLEPATLVAFASQQPVLWIVLSMLLVVASGAIGTVWLRGIDELAQRAHYVAWFWGGSFGLGIMAFFVIALPALGAFVDFDSLVRTVWPLGGAGAAFTAGVVFSVMALTAGYGLWWLAYWLRKR